MSAFSETRVHISPRWLTDSEAREVEMRLDWEQVGPRFLLHYCFWGTGNINISEFAIESEVVQSIDFEPILPDPSTQTEPEPQQTNPTVQTEDNSSSEQNNIIWPQPDPPNTFSSTRY